jgi:hypothetical protein
MNSTYQLRELINLYFGFLVSDYEFVKCREVEEDNTFFIEFGSTTVSLKLEKYRREIYVYLYKPTLPNNGINLFLLLQFLSKDTASKTESNYFTKILNSEENYKMQVQWIAMVLKSNIDKIIEFFLAPDIDEKIQEVNRYVMSKYPKLFLR